MYRDLKDTGRFLLFSLSSNTKTSADVFGKLTSEKWGGDVGFFFFFIFKNLWAADRSVKQGQDGSYLQVEGYIRKFISSK